MTTLNLYQTEFNSNPNQSKQNHTQPSFLSLDTCLDVKVILSLFPSPTLPSKS